MATDLWLGLAPIAVFAGVALLALLYRRIYWVGDRTAEEVLPYLRPLDLVQVEDLFNAGAERYLRLNLTPRQFRRAQRNRITLALEYIRRISHNALILQQWGMYEVNRARAAANREPGHLSAGMIHASVHCRMSSFVLRLRLHTWLFRIALLPLAAPPSFEVLTNFGSADLLEFYCKLRIAAVELGYYYGEVHQIKLVDSL
jgi:hypothetical protein